MEFSLFYAPGTFDFRSQVMGRQSAGHGFLRAALAAEPERIWCYAPSRDSAQIFGRDVLRLAGRPPELRLITWDQPARLANAGTLYRADPGVGDDAWHRRHYASARAYSLCGVTHTLSSHAAMSTLAGLVTAPLYPWDAVICTSTVARDVLRHIVEAEMDHLRARVGATSFTLPQMPLIPLGTHVADFAFTPEARASARDRLGLGEDDVAALFAGRLTFHSKGHPLPMFLGLQEAVVRTRRPVTLVLFGKFNHPAVEKAFRSEAALFAPDLRLVVLDGGSDADRAAAWAGCDLFTSLSDNVQETFGLTPIEAMAAGLPVVVSDWNGYKDTVRDGTDGFRIPVVMAPPGTGQSLSDRFEMRYETYDVHVGSVSQFTAVDVEAAATAYARLIGDPELRRSMGAAGRRRATEVFDWSVIFRRYVALWDELAERRRADLPVPDEGRRARRPARMDPFDLFRTYPTAALGMHSRVRLRGTESIADALSRKSLASVSYASAVLPSGEAITRLCGALSGEWTSVAGIMASCPEIAAPSLLRALVWLGKMGIVDIETPQTRPP